MADGLEQVLTPGSLLLTEPAALLAQQLQDTTAVESILSLIGNGVQTENELRRLSQIGKFKLAHYLWELSALRLIEERQRAFARFAERQERYSLNDPLFRFYYRCVAPHLNAVQREDTHQLAWAVMAELDAFIQQDVFARLCTDWIFDEGVHGTLGFIPQWVNDYWPDQPGGSARPLLVAAYPDDRQLFIAEDYWQKTPVGRQALKNLLQRSQSIPHVNDTDWTVQYGLFAREGFTSAAIAAARKMEARLVSLLQLESRLHDAVRSSSGI